MKDLMLKTATAVVALGLFAAPVALTVAAQPAQAQSQEFSDQQLEAFVVALDDIMVISGQLREQAEQASSQEEVEQLRQNANQQMVDAIQRAGLDVETYNEISNAMRTDAQLAEEIQEKQSELNGNQ